MTSTTATPTLSAKTLGVLAVVGLVVAFSLSSTLAKRAETPGVLIAFWRMVTVSVVWNAVLWATGRHITWADVKQVWLPGVLFGLNLAFFFTGVTHNSVDRRRVGRIECDIPDVTARRVEDQHAKAIFSLLDRGLRHDDLFLVGRHFGFGRQQIDGW